MSTILSNCVMMKGLVCLCVTCFVWQEHCDAHV